MNLKHLAYRARPYLRLNNLTLLIAVFVAVSWLFGTVSTLQKNFVLQQEVDSLDQQVEIAQIETVTLGFQQQYFRSNEYLELQARAKLNKALPGEKVVLLPKPPAVPVPTEQPLTPGIAAPSNFDQWMRFLFGRNDQRS